MQITAGKSKSNESSPDAPAAPDAAKTSATLAALLVGVISFQLNASMVAPAVPEIARKLSTTPELVGISQTLFSWSVESPGSF